MPIKPNLRSLPRLKKLPRSPRLPRLKKCDFFIYFFKTFKIGVFFENKDGFFEKKLNFNQNRQRWQICDRMRTKWFYLLKVSAALNMRSLSKNPKTLNVGKIRTNDEERVFFREKNTKNTKKPQKLKMPENPNFERSEKS